MNNSNMKYQALRDLLEIFDEENYLKEEGLIDCELVKEELQELIESNEDAREAFSKTGMDIDRVSQQIVKDNIDPYSGAGRLIDIAVRLMEAQGSDLDSIEKCVYGICEQYSVPERKRMEFMRIFFATENKI